MKTRLDGLFHAREEGVALIITVLLLMMVSAIGLSALQHAGDESTASASSRRKLATMYAADAAINVLADRLRNGQASSPTFTQPMDEQTFMLTKSGLPIAVRTGTADNAVPMPIRKVGSAAGVGGQFNIGAAATQSYGIYRVSVVATDPGGGRTQIQAQFRVPEGSANY